jgi:hypothetical protein
MVVLAGGEASSTTRSEACMAWTRYQTLNVVFTGV